ncbi:MAG: S-layer protein, partial [Methanoregula sp.]
MASIRAQATILIIIAACFVAPALAGTKYLDGTPNLTAYIAGTNEYLAGGDIQIPVVIENNGL